MMDDMKKDRLRRRIIDANAAYFGDIYVFFNDRYCTVHTIDFVEPLRFMVMEPYDVVIDKAYILDYVHSNFFGGNKVSMVGSGEVYLNGRSVINDTTLAIFARVKGTFLAMQDEYESFIDNVNNHLDEIIIKEGLVIK